jgi:hypothetical protein
MFAALPYLIHLIFGEQFDTRTLIASTIDWIRGKDFAFEKERADADDAARDGIVTEAVVEDCLVFLEEHGFGSHTKEILVAHLEVISEAVVDGYELVVTGMEIGELYFIHVTGFFRNYSWIRQER